MSNIVKEIYVTKTNNCIRMLCFETAGSCDTGQATATESRFAGFSAGIMFELWTL
jgi:hypothetical protein